MGSEKSHITHFSFLGVICKLAHCLSNLIKFGAITFRHECFLSSGVCVCVPGYFNYQYGFIVLYELGIKIPFFPKGKAIQSVARGNSYWKKQNFWV